MNRRHVIQSVLAGAAPPHFRQLWSASARPQRRQRPYARRVAGDEDYWTEIRNAFSVDRNIINLNNGYCSPSPRTVQDAMRRYLEYSDMGPYHTMVSVLERQVEGVRRRLAQAAGCDPEEIAITRNSSESLENAQYGIDLQARRRSPDHQPGLSAHAHDLPAARAARRHRAQDDLVPGAAARMDDLYQRFEQAVTPQDQADPGVPHHQSHRPDFPRRSASARWRTRAISR